MNKDDLRIYEELTLLAIRDKEGTLSAQYIHHAIAGAVLAELAMDGVIEVSDEETQAVSVIRDCETGDAVVDLCLRAIRDGDDVLSIRDWVTLLAAKPELYTAALENLCRKGILREDEGRVLLFFKRKIYPEVNPIPEGEVMTRLREVVFSDSAPVDARTAVLIALARETGALYNNFDYKKLKARQERLDSIASGDAVVGATASTIQAIRTAVAVASAMSAVMMMNMQMQMTMNN